MYSRSEIDSFILLCSKDLSLQKVLTEQAQSISDAYLASIQTKSDINERKTKNSAIPLEILKNEIHAAAHNMLSQLHEANAFTIDGLNHCLNIINDPNSYFNDKFSELKNGNSSIKISIARLIFLEAINDLNNERSENIKEKTKQQKLPQDLFNQLLYCIQAYKTAHFVVGNIPPTRSTTEIAKQKFQSLVTYCTAIIHHYNAFVHFKTLNNQINVLDSNFKWENAFTYYQKLTGLDTDSTKNIEERHRYFVIFRTLRENSLHRKLLLDTIVDANSVKLIHETAWTLLEALFISSSIFTDSYKNEVREKIPKKFHPEFDAYFITIANDYDTFNSFISYANGTRENLLANVKKNNPLQEISTQEISSKIEKLAYELMALENICKALKDFSQPSNDNAFALINTLYKKYHDKMEEVRKEAQTLSMEKEKRPNKVNTVKQVTASKQATSANASANNKKSQTASESTATSNDNGAEQSLITELTANSTAYAIYTDYCSKAKETQQTNLIPDVYGNYISFLNNNRFYQPGNNNQAETNNVPPETPNVDNPETTSPSTSDNSAIMTPHINLTLSTVLIDHLKTQRINEEKKKEQALDTSTDVTDKKIDPPIEQDPPSFAGSSSNSGPQDETPISKTPIDEPLRNIQSDLEMSADGTDRNIDPLPPIVESSNNSGSSDEIPSPGSSLDVSLQEIQIDRESLKLEQNRQVKPDNVQQNKINAASPINKTKLGIVIAGIVISLSLAFIILFVPGAQALLIVPAAKVITAAVNAIVSYFAAITSIGATTTISADAAGILFATAALVAGFPTLISMLIYKIFVPSDAKLLQDEDEVELIKHSNRKNLEQDASISDLNTPKPMPQIESDHTNDHTNGHSGPSRSISLVVDSTAPPSGQKKSEKRTASSCCFFPFWFYRQDSDKLPSSTYTTSAKSASSENLAPR